MRPERRAGFTLLEVMVTIAVVGGSLVAILALREKAQVQMYEARNANIARSLARQFLSEIEFRDPGTQKSGGFDGYDGFTYTLDIREVDLVTGDDPEDKNGDGFTKDDKTNSSSKKKKSSSSSAFKPGDAVDPEEDELEYPVRRVKLTIDYPNLSDSGDQAGKAHQLVIETILPALPKDDNVTDLTKSGKKNDK